MEHESYARRTDDGVAKDVFTGMLVLSRSLRSSRPRSRLHHMTSEEDELLTFKDLVLDEPSFLELKSEQIY